MNYDEEEIAQEERNIIPNDSLINDMVARLSGNTFWLFVFAAPAGSGKSTSINTALQLMKSKKLGMNLKLIRIGSTVLQNQKFHGYLKIPLNRPPSDYLPSNSCIK